MLDLRDELARSDVVQQLQLSLLDADPQIARREGSDEHHTLGRLGDVDETAGSGQSWTELADVEVPLAVGLRKPEKRKIESTTIVKVELIGLIDDRLRIDRSAEIQPGRRNAAD